MLTVVLSLLYLEDASPKLPNVQLQVTSKRPFVTPTAAFHDVVAPLGYDDDDEGLAWPVHNKKDRNVAGVGQKHGYYGQILGEGGLQIAPDVKVLNNLEIVAWNLSHQSSRNHILKESERLGVLQADGSIAIPPQMMSNTEYKYVSGRQRYIIYLCHENMSCCGWGDRQHGILSAYIISLVTNRTFGVDMSSPCPLVNLFHPRLLNWKINASDLVGLSTRHIYAVNDRTFRQVCVI